MASTVRVMTGRVGVIRVGEGVGTVVLVEVAVGRGVGESVGMGVPVGVDVADKLQRITLVPWSVWYS